MHRTPIVLTAFGTSTSACATYEVIEQRMRAYYPEHPLVWSFTSQRLRDKSRNQPSAWKSTEEVLVELHQQGYQQAVVQSLHIVPGYEYEKIEIAARCAPLQVSVGKPLLSSMHDCRRVVQALEPYLPASDPSHVAVLACHGTQHPGGAAQYAQFKKCLEERSLHMVFFAAVEGEPLWKNVLEQIRTLRVSRVSLIPFMLVAGVHIREEVLGENSGSWRSCLSGYEVASVREGLGYNNAILALYADHIRSALHALHN